MCRGAGLPSFSYFLRQISRFSNSSSIRWSPHSPSSSEEIPSFKIISFSLGLSKDPVPSTRIFWKLFDVWNSKHFQEKKKILFKKKNNSLIKTQGVAMGQNALLADLRDLWGIPWASSCQSGSNFRLTWRTMVGKSLSLSFFFLHPSLSLLTDWVGAKTEMVLNYKWHVHSCKFDSNTLVKLKERCELAA